MGQKIKELVQLIIDSILDIIFPRENRCLICKEEDSVGLCHNCLSKLKRVKEQDGILSYGYYGNILKDLILKFKYHKDYFAGEILAGFLIELIKENNIKGDYICYIPMSKKSVKKRGFNQCELMAKNISKKLGIPVSHCIKKVKDTAEQKTLNKEDRKNNIVGAFDLLGYDQLKGKDIILIDDVVTTGATLIECEKILKDRGLGKIIVLTIAKSDI